MDTHDDGSVRRIAVLGSTGSIGTQTLEVAGWRGYRVVGLAAGGNVELLLEQAHRWRPELIACHPAVADRVRAGLPSGTRLATGVRGACEVAGRDADVIVAAIPGIAGLEPTLAAARSGRRLALANKEAMVVAGPLVWQAADAAGTEIVPVDSEHSALFQCLRGEASAEVAELILTASGGPFLRGPDNLSAVTPDEALAHPNWSMGARITIDSATLFNKGLEVLEASSLFGVGLDAIRVVVHPQSLVHGLVRFTDGSLKAQIGPHDMRPVIQYALTWPARAAVPLDPLPLDGCWEFGPPDLERFPALTHAYRAGEVGGVAPAALNAADEVAVAAFLDRRIPFTAIAQVLEGVLDEVEDGGMDGGVDGSLNLEALARADREARRRAEAQVVTLAGRGGR